MNPLKDQTSSLAGWPALRYLKNQRSPESHFLAMSKAADGSFEPGEGRLLAGPHGGSQERWSRRHRILLACESVTWTRSTPARAPEARDRRLTAG